MIPFKFTPSILQTLMKWHLGQPPDGLLETSALKEVSDNGMSFRGTEDREWGTAGDIHTHLGTYIHAMRFHSFHAKIQVTTLGASTAVEV